MTMTLDEWKQKREAEKRTKESLEKMRQLLFQIEQAKEPVFTREFNSVVDCDN